VPEQMPRERRIHNAKMLVAFAIAFAAWAIGAPVIRLHVPEFWDMVPYFVLIGLMYFQGLGAGALLGISSRSQKARDIALGAGSATLMLAIAPESIRVALIRMPISYRWVVASVLGTIAVVAYLWLALRYWKARRAVT
jgi:hypothetical protein